jgi:glycosidase
MNGGKFDGAALSDKERELNDFYVTLLNFTKNSIALTGEYREIHSYNRTHTQWYNDHIFSFVRWKGNERLIIVSNFDPDDTFGFELQLPREIITIWNLEDGSYTLKDQLTDRSIELGVSEGSAETRIDMEPLQSFILQLQ